MATFTPSWTEGIVLHASSVITAGNSVNDTIDLKDISGGPYFGVNCQFDLDVASGTPNGDVTIEAFSSADGTNLDTIAFKTMRVPFSAIANKKVSTVVYGVPLVNWKISNGTGQSVTYIGRAAGLKQASA